MKKLSGLIGVVLVVLAAGWAANYHFGWVATWAGAGTADGVYYCPMHPDVQSNKPGDCPICSMTLVKKPAEKAYYCPMHPDFQSDKPGDCAICGMSLVKKTAGQGPAMGHGGAPNTAGKLLYYRNPMNPDVTSPVPMKDEMGMDYVPVYEQAAGAGGVFISAEKQQMIGVKKAKAEVRDLTGEITTVGRVANDPNLFVAQEEYLQAIKGQATMGKAMPYAGGESEAFKKTAKLRLMLLGMSEEEIAALEKSGKAQQNLYLPTAEDKHIWVYITVYEYEARFVKPGLEVAVETAAMPGRVLSGKIISIGPVVEATTRSLKVRALVENPDNQLKLEMYVNVRIHYDLGEKLCVPEEAVMRLGTRDIVYAAEPNDHFAVREVILGAKAGKYIEVLKGIEPNEAVVTSGNFLIDSETKLRSKI